MDNTQLLQRIEKLEKEIQNLKQSSTIPLEIDNSFLGRGFTKLKSPAIYLDGADQGAWLNTGAGSDMAFPPAFARITDGDFAGFWIPLYIPPSQIT